MFHVQQLQPESNVKEKVLLASDLRLIYCNARYVELPVKMTWKL